MNVETTEMLVRRCIEERITPLVWGKHGIGKSQIIKKIGEDMGFDEVIDLRLGQLEVGDLIGMPAQEYFCPRCGKVFGTQTTLRNCPICAEKDEKNIPISGRTIWLPPSWFPQNGESRLIFFDELNRGRLDVQQAAFQIVLDFKIHTHRIPSNCAVVCACNPSGMDEYNVEELDLALLDRFVNIKFTLTRSEWLNWAKGHNIMQEIVSFIMLDGKHLGADPIDIPIEITPTPRSYEFLSKLLNPSSDKFTKIPKGKWAEVAATLLGEASSMAFVASLERDIDKPLRADEIFNKFPTKKIQEKLNAQLDPENARHDLLNETVQEILREFQNDSTRYSDKQLNNAGDFLAKIPSDLVFSALKDMAKIPDINNRLLHHRNDLFDILRDIRSKGKNGNGSK